MSATLDEVLLELREIKAALQEAVIAKTTAKGASTNNEDDRLWSAEEVARYLGCSKATVYEWAEDGSIPNQRIARLLRFDPAVIRAWAKNPPATGKVLPLVRKPKGSQ